MMKLKHLIVSMNIMLIALINGYQKRRNALYVNSLLILESYLNEYDSNDWDQKDHLVFILLVNYRRCCKSIFDIKI